MFGVLSFIVFVVIGIRLNVPVRSLGLESDSYFFFWFFFFFLLDRSDFVVVESSSEDDIDDDLEGSGLEGGEPDGPLPPSLPPPSGGSPPPPYPRKVLVSVSTSICD